ncbi:cob(I)yrinic acid a,c-diamide adenosyltransferase [Patescibacteria group bacterium]
MSEGKIHIYTGDGKGKTTAALGLAVRAVGAGKRVAIVYFDKGGDHYSERDVLDDRFGDMIDWYATGLDRIDPETGEFRYGVTEQDAKEAERGVELARELVESENYDVVILDEINTTVRLSMASEQDVLDILDAKPPHVELVLTGRDAPESFRKVADLVSEIKAEKHYFEEKVLAKEGVDF